MNSKKDNLFMNLEKLLNDMVQLTKGDREKANRILFSVEEIVGEFNRGKQTNGPKELDLDDTELKQLQNMINDIWHEADKRDIEVRPKPDIVHKIG